MLSLRGRSVCEFHGPSMFRRREYRSIAAVTVLEPQAHYSSPQVRLHMVEAISDELIADLRDESPQRGYRAGAAS
jgi:hypothetical protein